MDRSTKVDVDVGVSQGSVFGPTLWNIFCDDVVNLKFPKAITAIAYADNLALLVEAEDVRHLVFKTDESLEQTSY